MNAVTELLRDAATLCARHNLPRPELRLDRESAELLARLMQCTYEYPNNAPARQRDHVMGFPIVVVDKDAS